MTPFFLPVLYWQKINCKYTAPVPPVHCTPSAGATPVGGPWPCPAGLLGELQGPLLGPLGQCGPAKKECMSHLLGGIGNRHIVQTLFQKKFEVIQKNSIINLTSILPNSFFFRDLP